MNSHIKIQEQTFSKTLPGLSVGIANINSRTGSLEYNKHKIIQALEFFSEKDVTLAIFPENCFSGYFWEPEEKCSAYPETAHMGVMRDWFEDLISTYINDRLKYIVLNGLEKHESTRKKFYNTTIVLDRTRRYLKNENIRERRTYSYLDDFREIQQKSLSAEKH